MPDGFCPVHRDGLRFVTDRARRSPGLVRARRLEETYARDLRKIARHVGEIVKAWMQQDGDLSLSNAYGLKAALDRYAEVITPWAGATANRMVAEVAIKERRAWAEQAKRMSRALMVELERAPTGDLFRRIRAEQVEAITSLPRDAASRVYEMTTKGLADSTRASEYVDAIMRSGDVTISRANMLARTAVSTTSSALTESRAQHVGSPGYYWRTAEDSDVRPSHAGMDGKFVAWNNPPVLDGYRAHAGRFANCRCYCEPVLPEA